jgi:hypothetical protein
MHPDAVDLVIFLGKLQYKLHAGLHGARCGRDAKKETGGGSGFTRVKD